MAQRRFSRKIFQRKRSNFTSVLLYFSVLVLFCLFVFFVLFVYYSKDLPRPEKFTERHLTLPTKIYDRSGKVLLYEIYGEEKRTPVPLEKVPRHLLNAIIVAEDTNFYHHFGLDFKGILRAALINLKTWKPIYGGSTITQQLVRSSFLTRKKTLERKIKEIILALELERRYSKHQILEFYINQVPFGSNAYGVESASQTLFKKSVSELTLAEAATLASLIRSPSYLSPFGEHRDKLLQRKNYILDRMIKEGYITQNQADSAKKQKLSFSKITQPIRAPHFVMYIKDQLTEKYGENFLKEKGLKVFTTLDWQLQQLAEKVIKKSQDTNQAFNARNAALVAISPQTGQILAMVGSANYWAKTWPKGCQIGVNCAFEPKVNVATYGIGRQPGSAFKPFAYALAFKKGYTPETLLWDVKTEFNPYCPWSALSKKDRYSLNCYHPQNYDQKFRGLVSFRQALAQSLNVPSVKVLYLAGIKETIQLSKKLGISTLNQPRSWYGLSLILGGGEVKLLDMVSAYGVFANRGKKISPTAILKIKDFQGNILAQNKKTPKKILKIQICRIINDILSDNRARAPMFGQQSPLFIPGYQVAVKTGTTQNFRDAWTIGYSPTLVTGVWVGNNDSRPMAKKPGAILAAPIWKAFMEKALLKFSKKKFKEPNPIFLKKPILRGKIKKPYHSILYYVQKDNPRGPRPQSPQIDPQYSHWEQSLKNWLRI